MSAIRYLVGYRPNERGQDALSLAITLAQSFGAALDLVFVVREHSNYAPAYPPVGRDEELIAQKSRVWLEEAAATVPPGVEVAIHVRFGPSVARGLMTTADELDSALIVIGAGSSGLVRRHQLGTVAATLLHRATRPVTLVPRSYRALGPIEHIDCAVGMLSGRKKLLEEAVQVAARRDLPVRFITMVDLDGADKAAKAAPGGEQQSVGASVAGADPAEFVRGHVERMLEEAVVKYGAPASTQIVMARGGIRAAVESVAWKEASILLIGSSRLAKQRRFSLGSTAHAILRAVSVPVVAVPAGAHLEGSGGDESSSTSTEETP